MSRNHSYNDKLNCPSCGSHATQSVPTAYSQSVRTGSSGFTSISIRGESLAPPPEKDEKLLPGLVVCFVAGVALFTLPDLLDELPMRALHDLSLFSWPVLLGGCLIGWAAGLAFAIPAISYNVNVRPGLLAAWEAGVVCNRCGHQWHRALPAGEEFEGFRDGN